MPLGSSSAKGGQLVGRKENFERISGLRWTNRRTALSGLDTEVAAIAPHETLRAEGDVAALAALKGRSRRSGEDSAGREGGDEDDDLGKHVEE